MTDRPRLTGRTVLRAPGGRLVHLAAGDPLPEWADGQVGSHLLDVPVPVKAPVPMRQTGSKSRPKG